MDEKLYWLEVPPWLKKKLRFFNFAVETDPASPKNPLNIIRRIYRPGDFVVLKLDIDNEKVSSRVAPRVKVSAARIWSSNHASYPDSMLCTVLLEIPLDHVCHLLLKMDGFI